MICIQTPNLSISSPRVENREDVITVCLRLNGEKEFDRLILDCIKIKTVSLSDEEHSAISVICIRSLIFHTVVE